MSLRPNFDTRWVYISKKKLFELHLYDGSNDVIIAILTWEGSLGEEDYWCTFVEPLLGPSDECWHLQAKNVTDAEEEIERMIVWLAEYNINKLSYWIRVFKGE